MSALCLLHSITSDTKPQQNHSATQRRLQITGRLASSIVLYSGSETVISEDQRRRIIQPLGARCFRITTVLYTQPFTSHEGQSLVSASPLTNSSPGSLAESQSVAQTQRRPVVQGTNANWGPASKHLPTPLLVLLLSQLGGGGKGTLEAALASSKRNHSSKQVQYQAL